MDANIPDDVMARDAYYNKLAKELFSIDFENKEFHFIMLAGLISTLLKKGVFTEQEYAESVDEMGTAFKLMKYRKNLQENVDNPEP